MGPTAPVQSPRHATQRPGAFHFFVRYFAINLAAVPFNDKDSVDSKIRRLIGISKAWRLRRTDQTDFRRRLAAWPGGGGRLSTSCQRGVEFLLSLSAIAAATADAFPISAVSVNTDFAVFASAFRTTTCVYSKCRKFHCFFSGADCS